MILGGLSQACQGMPKKTIKTLWGSIQLQLVFQAEMTLSVFFVLKTKINCCIIVAWGFPTSGTSGITGK